MIGAVYYGPRDVRIEEVPDPKPREGEVVIEVSRNGICGSDLHTFLGGSMGGASMHLPNVVLGHEFAGTVHEVGASVGDLDPGTSVAVAPIEWCGMCWSCRHGLPNLCRQLAIYGGYRRPLHGGLATYVCVSRRCCFPLPPGLGVVEAALSEPVAVAAHAVRRVPLLLGAHVAVLGAGPIGLGILAAARKAGASTTIVSEKSESRRNAARSFGATGVLDPTVEALETTVGDLTSGEGADVIFDTTGAHAAIEGGIAALRPRGLLVSVAGWQERAQVNMEACKAKELDLRFSMTYEPEVDFPLAMDLLSSDFMDTDTMISDQIPLTNLVQGGLEELLHHPERHVKILVDPSATA